MTESCGFTTDGCPARAICEDVNRCAIGLLRNAGYAVTPQSWTLPRPARPMPVIGRLVPSGDDGPTRIVPAEAPPFRYVAKARQPGARKAHVIGSADVLETARVMCESFVREEPGDWTDVWIEDSSAPDASPPAKDADAALLAVVVDLLIKTLPVERRDVLMVAYRSWLDAPR